MLLPLLKLQLPQYYIIYKPYQVLSQFSLGAAGVQGAETKATLKDFFHVPGDVYPVGRLDYDSEGLLVLTNDKRLNHRLLNPAFSHEREYWVQVEGLPDQAALRLLGSGVDINVDGKNYHTKKCHAEIFRVEPVVPIRVPPVRFRQNIPTTWIRMVLTEGKNRQVRKMTAKVGHPTLRLIRYRIGRANVSGLQPGAIKELNAAAIEDLLFK
jgi:23S rRNA pseudouridine2457 synthase